MRAVRRSCPGESEYRYLARIRETGAPGRLDPLSESFGSGADTPLLLQGLPSYPDIQDSKVLALVVGESLGACVAYSDYNQSYLTDISPSTGSRESSAGTSLLGMHNDFPFIDDLSRPRVLVLLAHRAQGVVPKTLLAPSAEIIAGLSDATRRILAREHFEARVGGKLAWRREQVYRFALLEGGTTRVRFHFDAITPTRGLSPQEHEDAASALAELRVVALEIGRRRGHRIREGEALIIPNDHCLHGREEMRREACDRLLLRAYVVPEEIVAIHGSSMLALSGVVAR
ncbi:TauD/TfdA family dioxygenase [Embleya sp. NPDC001921]